MFTPIAKDNDIKQLRKFIEQSENVVITCHVAPDGDAIGSTLALANVLDVLGLNARVIVPDTPPKNLRFLPGAKEIVVYSQYESFADELIADADLIFALDYNDSSRVDRMETAILDAKCPKVMIDHHLFPGSFTDIVISHPESSSTCLLLFKTLCALSLADVIDKETATCIYTGMMTDTGNFSYNSNDPDIYIVISELLKKGIDKDRIYKQVFDCNSPNRLRLNGYALDSKMEILDECCTAIIALTRKELNHYQYKKGDTEGLVNQPLTIPEIVYSFYLREEDGYIHISARSKGDNQVNHICEDHFNGGGHKNAAGGKYNGTLEDAVEQLRSVMIEHCKESKPIHDIQ